MGSKHEENEQMSGGDDDAPQQDATSVSKDKSLAQCYFSCNVFVTKTAQYLNHPVAFQSGFS